MLFVGPEQFESMLIMGGSSLSGEQHSTVVGVCCFVVVAISLAVMAGPLWRITKEEDEGKPAKEEEEEGEPVKAGALEAELGAADHSVRSQRAN